MAFLTVNNFFCAFSKIPTKRQFVCLLFLKLNQGRKTKKKNVRFFLQNPKTHFFRGNGNGNGKKRQRKDEDCLDDSKICPSLPKPFRILLKFVEKSLEILNSRPYYLLYLFARLVGRKMWKTIDGGSYAYPLVENGILETLGHLKNPVPPPSESVHRALRGLPYSNIFPVNRYVQYS